MTDRTLNFPFGQLCRDCGHPMTFGTSGWRCNRHVNVITYGNRSSKPKTPMYR